jgi:membrane protease YdiL (CAAX protease family)
MNALITIIKRHPLVAYFFLAYAFSWTLVALIPVSFVFALLALFGPTLAAIIVSGANEGRSGVGRLLRSVISWRTGIAWYAVAIGVPLIVAVAVLGVQSVVAGTPFSPSAGTPIALMILLAMLVVGEEIGWRGFALPHLQERYNGLAASLILGTLWAGWHLANGTIPGLQTYWSGFPAFLFFVIAQTILFTWLSNHTRGSVLLSWVFHASINVTNALFFIGDQVRQWLLVGLGFSVFALVVVLVEGPNLARIPQTTAHHVSREYPILEE